MLFTFNLIHNASEMEKRFSLMATDWYISLYMEHIPSQDVLKWPWMLCETTVHKNPHAESGIYPFKCQVNTSASP